MTSTDSTLHARLVRLFIAQGICRWCKGGVPLKDGFHEWGRTGHSEVKQPCPIAHLATLAVEQARQFVDERFTRAIRKVDLIDALGEVKR